MLRKNITLFLAGLGIAMMAPGQSSASEIPSTGDDSLGSSDSSGEIATRPAVSLARMPATFQEAVGLWVKKGSTWYAGLTDTQKQGANAFYSYIERGNNRTADHRNAVLNAVQTFYHKRHIHQFKTRADFQAAMGRLSDTECAQFFSQFMKCIPKGKLSASKYYVVGMRFFSQLPESEQTFASMQTFTGLYESDCYGIFVNHRHNEKVRWRMIRDRLNAHETVTMADVEGIFNGPRNKVHLAKGVVEKGPGEVLEAAAEIGALIIFAPLLLGSGGGCCC